MRLHWWTTIPVTITQFLSIGNIFFIDTVSMVYICAPIQSNVPNAPKDFFIAIST